MGSYAGVKLRTALRHRLVFRSASNFGIRPCPAWPSMSSFTLKVSLVSLEVKFAQRNCGARLDRYTIFLFQINIIEVWASNLTNQLCGEAAITFQSSLRSNRKQCVINHNCNASVVCDLYLSEVRRALIWVLQTYARNDTQFVKEERWSKRKKWDEVTLITLICCNSQHRLHVRYISVGNRHGRVTVGYNPWKSTASPYIRTDW